MTTTRMPSASLPEDIKHAFATLPPASLVTLRPLVDDAERKSRSLLLASARVVDEKGMRAMRAAFDAHLAALLVVEDEIKRLTSAASASPGDDDKATK
jgi:hypothetical protein